MRYYYYLFTDFDYSVMLRVYAENKPEVGKAYKADKFNSYTREWEAAALPSETPGTWVCTQEYDFIGEGLSVGP